MRLALAFCLIGSAAGAQAVGVVPVFGDLVAFGLPPGFEPKFEQENGGSFILEAVPVDESVQRWSQMLTLTAGAGMAGMPPADFAGQIAAGFRQACPATYSAEGLPPPPIAGATGPVYAAYVACGNVGGHSEEMVIVVFASATNLFTLQWAERWDASQVPLAYVPEVWDPRLNALAADTEVCAPVPGEGPPYPSCGT